MLHSIGKNQFLVTAKLHIVFPKLFEFFSKEFPTTIESINIIPIKPHSEKSNYTLIKFISHEEAII